MEPIRSIETTTYSPEQPEGYCRIAVNGCISVAREWACDTITVLLKHETLHHWASLQKPHEVMQGRGINYGVMLPAGSSNGGSTPVVVRRNRHGGLLRYMTGEYFLYPSRAPRELQNYLELSSNGVKTPELIAYALYPARMNLVRSDVVTRRLPPGGDFPELWRNSRVSDREMLLASVAELLRSMTKAGAWHADLNMKNIYLAGDGSNVTAYLLDIDRVTFLDSGKVSTLNFNRLAHSARKWGSKWGLDFDVKYLDKLDSLSKEQN